MSDRMDGPAPQRAGAGPEITGERSVSNYTGSPASKFLSRVSTVKETAPGEWICSCPGPLHDRGDRNPSLSLKEEQDGTLLVHCYAGCETDSIMTALRLELSDLYPEPISKHKSPLSQFQRKRHGQARDALRAIRYEILITRVAAGMIRNGEALDDDALDRLATAEYRIAKAAEVGA